MRGGSLLHSHTPHTAAQEIAALVLATALIAWQRMDVAEGTELPALRISFAKTVTLLEPLWITFQLGEGILTDRQKGQLIERFYEQLVAMATGKPRTRSCPRKLRQPVSSWPRKLKNEHHQGPVSCEIPHSTP